MDNFNKVISFILGLVVIVVFIAVLTGRFNLKDKLASLGKTTPTPTMTITPTPTGSYGSFTPTPTYRPYNGGNPSTIPSTGSPTILLPLLMSSATLGSFLRRKK